MNKRIRLTIMAVLAAAVLLLASSCTTPGNHQPIIASLRAEASWAVPSGSLQVTCTASDPDGDELSYNWSASGGEIDGEGATVNWTAPLLGGSYVITVTVIDGQGGQVTDQVTIMVRANEPPTITSLVADAQWISLSGSVQVTCTASDPDGDELSYEWSASAGEIWGTGAVVNWTAPQEVGIYHVTVVVTDNHGSSATDSLPISVVTGQAPTIESLLVTADHCYLKTYSWGYKVGKLQEYHFECIVSGTSGGVSYEWSCTGGSISGDGSMITWTAPNESTDVTVTVTVSDIIGNTVSESVLLEVVACSPCTFPC
ncbi:MAG: PKD domain-containing protein [Chloroflexota bacterium]